MHADELVKLIAALGIGSGVSAVVTAYIAAKSTKGKSRAEAADLLIGAAERVGKMNQDQDALIKELKLKQDLIHAVFLQYLAEEISREELLKVMKELR
jgi:hypothetical protein